MEALTNMYEIDKRFITPYNPRANGTGKERTKRKRMLKKYFEGAFDEWRAGFLQYNWH